MPPKLDPYEELGLPRDATEADVRAAYRRRAKETHPDTNPDDPDAPERFGRAMLSQLVLLDPKRREKFDRTGTVDEEEPDNARALALTMIEPFIEQAVGEYINSGFDPKLDPRRRDLLAEFRDKMNNEIGQCEVAIMEGAKARKFIEDMARRFVGKDKLKPIERGFERRLIRIDANVQVLREGMEARRMALEIVAAYEFKADAPPVPTYYPFAPSSGY